MQVHHGYQVRIWNYTSKNSNEKKIQHHSYQVRIHYDIETNWMKKFST